jgi:hypothetical protein
MPKGINPDDVVKAALKLLNANKSKVSGVVDDAVGAGKGLAAAAAKAVKGTGPKPPKPKMPKNPPKSGRGAKGPSKAEKAHHGGTIDPKTGKEFTAESFAKRNKKSSADAAERAAIKEAKSEANSAAWAKQREAYNEMKAIERKERKAQNKANWAKTLEEKYGGNVSAAAKGTSKASKRNKKDAK